MEWYRPCLSPPASWSASVSVNWFSRARQLACSHDWTQDLCRSAPDFLRHYSFTRHDVTLTSSFQSYLTEKDSKDFPSRFQIEESQANYFKTMDFNHCNERR
ncbi:hypothetical protein AVEN_6848-1 [Araneus ventricosus]|uniref:Uncharacterized protein n=1 Tax=Araneus ventricosus TaxID=182803 RepID=A0A4Y2GT04_ARAVE|nr:hypothetical protein AVEN_6848-1 [Araneus ventricosus]